MQRPRDRNESHVFGDNEQTSFARCRYKLEKKKRILIGGFKFGP